MSGAPPGYWLHETSGVLVPAVTAYLRGQPLSDRHIGAIRAYLRQWIAHPGWTGPMIDVLRTQIDELTSREEIDRWLHRAIDTGIDPL